MKLNDMTPRHIVIVKSQDEYNKVCEILNNKYNPYWLFGFAAQTEGVVNILTLTNNMKCYTDGQCSPIQNGYLTVTAADFIASNNNY